MAKIMIVYYSLEGSVDFLARCLAKNVDADLCRLETVKPYPTKGIGKFLFGGRDASFGVKPPLQNAIPDLAAYDTVVIGTPVWAGKPAAPMNTFLSEADLSGKNILLVVSSAGGSPQKTIAIITKAASQKGGKVTDSIAFVNPLKKPTETAEAVKAFSQKINKE